VVNYGQKGREVEGEIKPPRFKGRSLAKLDDKGRLRIPAKFKEVLKSTGVLVVTKMGERLLAYPLKKWAEIEAKASDLSQVNESHLSFLRLFISCAEDCEIDNQGRILIPPLLRDEAHLNQDVMLVGMLSSFEIWDKSAYDLQAERDRINSATVMQEMADRI
jgi:MraZ protein